MEIFRPLVDEIVYNNLEFAFEKTYKYKLIDVCNRLILIKDKEQYLTTAVSIFITNVFNFLEEKENTIINSSIISGYYYRGI